ncbi:PH domain-containing protein [Riemerella anatipestifer]|uniref:PH domain-containing protein n=1 Tax=Riemerella anatipestifer TaxID=34085 RepID=UPI00069B3C22|nr:PH domain-containing protein [Riemerella anatipestifer]MDR7694131.1 PH domain-containing protein [Riemerella anatipestifer]MDY3528891.1 PH domain-containing protein [Riemerella anatipestifer]MDY3538263.1 PH domain-containing protein [Riemerella anatipestifer]
MENIAETKIKYQTRPPWIFNILPITYIIIGVLGTIAFSLANGIIKFLGFFLVLLTFKGIFKLLQNLTTKIYLTDKNITIMTGFIIGNTIDISLDKSESIWISQGVLGKLFNYGCLSITTAGIKISQYIKNPMKFRYLINEIKTSLK